MKHLSIIIPVYNVAPYVGVCVDSIYRQGIKEEDFEVILINDGSTDNSLQIITEIEKQHTNITILTQKNQGVSISRNEGIRRATGKFILFLDSDDLLIPNTLCHLLEYALKYNTDMVQGRFIKLNNEEIENGEFPHSTLPDKEKIDTWIKSGEKAFIEDYHSYESYVWVFLFKREFIRKNKLSFLEHKYFEDILFTTTSILKAESFLPLPILFYAYRQHDNSIMSTINVTKLCSMNDIIQNLCLLLDDKTLSTQIRTKLEENIYASFSVNLWYLSHHRDLYPHRKEVINDLRQKVPHLFFRNSYKQRLASFCFKYMPSLYVSFRYYFARHKY